MIEERWWCGCHFIAMDRSSRLLYEISSEKGTPEHPHRRRIEQIHNGHEEGKPTKDINLSSGCADRWYEPKQLS